MNKLIIIHLHSEFDNWKDEFEEKHKCSYSKYGKVYTDRLGNKCNDLRCNRSGYYKKSALKREMQSLQVKC